MCVCVCDCMSCVCSGGGKKRVSDFLELELQAVVMGTGNLV